MKGVKKRLRQLRHVLLPIIRRHPRLFGLVIVLIGAAIFVMIATLHQTSLTHKSASQNTAGQTTPSPADGLVPGTPKYTVLLPSGKSLKDLGGGWVRSDAQPSFVYIDKIGSSQLNVSEQPLPDSFKKDPTTQIKQLADTYGATQKVTISSQTLYIGTYDQGLQRVIFTKDDLLILITSTATLSTSQWATYSNSLN